MSASSDRLARLDPALLTDLRRRYAEPQRHYHTWAHIEALLRWFDQRVDTLADPDAVFLAVLFHDAIYEPKRSDNEAASARLLTSTHLPGWSASSIAVAEAMTLATARHELPAIVEGADDIAQFLDMDLSILGAEPAIFRKYDRAIRREYAHVFWPIYWLGRRRILRAFRDRPSLYFTAWGRDAFEAAARRNLASVLGH